MTAEQRPLSLTLDERGQASLDGTWEFFPGDHDRADLDHLQPESISVPGLWEAQGHLALDGYAWYRLRFIPGDPAGWWTLRFAAVMDTAEVYLNGRLLGGHLQPFTPFELPAGQALVAGLNVLDVRVHDPSVDDPEHIRSAHGKQGWANQVFPSRPSLYLTYGGIWQSVTLRRHGRVVSRDAFLNGDADNLVATVEVVNLSGEPADAIVSLRTLGLARTDRIRLLPEERRTLTWQLGRTPAARWSPDDPVLHEALIDVEADGLLADRSRVRYGLRTVRIDGTRLLVNGRPYRMKSVLVQGFTAEELYAEGPRATIEAEVRAAQAMGFTMLRLHIKAFDPTYVDVCDELGMLVHSDLPIAEPIAHEELGDGTELSRRCAEAVGQQVRRDRNHPSIVLWSAMNELGLDREGVRGWDVYEQFARTIYQAVVTADDTRPVIENDWVEPDPDRVFCSPVLTAHWYGRLHADYLDTLDRKAAQVRDVGRPLFVTELGDWGLPEMPLLQDAPFWDARAGYAAGLATTLWPSSMARFVHETQRYQGLSDRMQIEVLRQHDHIGGYCLTELTDVPREFNGLLDLHRRPKPAAVQEIVRVNQPVLPMLRLDSLVVVAGQVISAPLHVANDGPALPDVTVELRFGGTAAVTAERQVVGELPADTVTSAGTISVRAPEVPGTHDLLLTLRTNGGVLAENRYPVHVVGEPVARHPIQVAGAGANAESLARALSGVGAEVGTNGPTFVAEGTLDADLGEELSRRVGAGETVVVLAQTMESGAHYPVPVELAAVETAWGSSVFHFTTDHGGLPSLPRRNLLVAEESTVQARNVIVRVGGEPFPDEPVVIAYKPLPGSITGTVVGLHRVAAGRLLLCQYRLAARAAGGDPAARALLADLVQWAAAPRPPTDSERVTKDDGRALTYYSFPATS
ncbi:MAG: glycoside hydrolase family 2 TIM barrel-domain containing protein [Pseudonocardiales bacterium]